MTHKGDAVHKPVTVTRGMLLYFVAAMLLSTLAVSFFNVWYTNHVQTVTEHNVRVAKQADDHRWCASFALFDVPVPPTIKDPVQRQRSEKIVREMHKLRVEHGCIKS